MWHACDMQCEVISPNAITFACIVAACGSIGAIDECKNTHSEIVRRDLLRKDTVLESASAGMYAECNMLTKAHEGMMRFMSGTRSPGSLKYQHGETHEALHCYERVVGER
mgnify:CR=1 FL=1